jgi:methyltransferase (TIGR00027 family)
MLAALLVERIGQRERARRGAGDFAQSMAVRTRFFDNAVLDAINRGIQQVVILGAGYDGRALRFRSPHVRFFEVDHPATQADKRGLLDQVGASTEGVTFVSADFTEPGLADALERAGHSSNARSLFTCEGVLRYLPERSFRDLLRVAAERAAPGSVFAVSISTRESTAAQRPEREQRLEDIGEPVLTVPTRSTALAWLAESGWSEASVQEIADDAPDTRPGRLLVRAERRRQAAS